MRIHIIACRMFTRSLSAVICDAPHSIDVTWLPQGLHNTPQVLHRELEKAIDQVHQQVESRLIRRPDCIVLGYGLCANGEFPDGVFLTVPPGFAIRYSDGPDRMVAVPEGA